MAMKANYIYALREPDTGLIRYIGKTTNPHRRWLNHLCCKERSHRTCWIKGLAKRGLRPDIVILEKIIGEWPWQESERFWISYARREGWPLINESDGGNAAFENVTRHYGENHWTRKRPDLVRRGDENGARKHPEFIWRGSRCKSSKLTEAQVAVIRRLLIEGITHQELAERYAVTRRTINYIANGKVWKHA